MTSRFAMSAPPDRDDGSGPTNAAEYTVSELSRAVKRTVEDGFGQVRVRGEISGFRGRHASGHCYLSLKDADASLDAVIWKSGYARLTVKPEEGLEVVATGRLTTYPRKSSYQLVIDHLAPAGVGALMKLLEERRKALAAEGLFDEARKRPLPLMPRVIGVVTSPTGAVIRDILHRVTDRFPAHVVVWPVRVQGETCGGEVAAAVTGFASAYGGPRPDVIIVARGGGSVEDLWGYNDEALVRAVAASPIPVVSAVGHETDWTLVDHAADYRAPTPTGAAERVVPVRSECLSAVADRTRRLDVAMSALLQRRRADLRLLSRGLPTGLALLLLPRQRLDAAADKLANALVMTTSAARGRYLATAGRLTPACAQRPVHQARDRLGHAARRLALAADARLAQARAAHAAGGARLRSFLLERRLGEAADVLRRVVVRRDRAVDVVLLRARTHHTSLSKLLEAVSHKAVLRRGFAVVRRTTDEPVCAAAAVGKNESLQLEFADGRVTVTEGSAPRPQRTAVRPVRRSKRASDAQGVLF